MCGLQYHLPFCVVVSLLSLSCPLMQKIFDYDKVLFISLFSFVLYAFGVHLRINSQVQGHKDYPVFF